MLTSARPGASYARLCLSLTLIIFFFYSLIALTKNELISIQDMQMTKLLQAGTEIQS